MSNRGVHSSPRTRAPTPLARSVPVRSCEDRWRDTARGHVCVSRLCSLRTHAAPRPCRTCSTTMVTDRYWPAWARTLVLRARRRAGQTRISSMPCISCGKCPRNLNRRRHDWRLRLPLLADDSLEDLHSAHQIVPIHHERRKDAECVFSGCKREQTFVPPALHDLVR